MPAQPPAGGLRVDGATTQAQEKHMPLMAKLTTGEA